MQNRPSFAKSAKLLHKNYMSFCHGPENNQ